MSLSFMWPHKNVRLIRTLVSEGVGVSERVSGGEDGGGKVRGRNLVFGNLVSRQNSVLALQSAFTNAVSFLPIGILRELTSARPVTCSKSQSKGEAVLGSGCQTFVTDPQEEVHFISPSDTHICVHISKAKAGNDI